MQRADSVNAFLITFLLILLYGVGRLFLPFAGALLSAVCIAVCLYPLYEKFIHRTPRWNKNLHALAMLGLVMVFIIVPLALIAWTMVLESDSFGAVMKAWSTSTDQWKQGQIGTQNAATVKEVYSWLHRTFGMSVREIQQHLANRVGQTLEGISKFGADLAANVFIFIFHLMLMLFALFFLFRDGGRFSHHIMALVPLRQPEKERIFERMRDTIVGVARGWILTSMIQGVLATLGYLFVGIDGAVLLGVFTALIGLLPIVGSWGVWMPVVIVLWAKGMVGKSLFLFFWGVVVVVGTIDVLVRPYLMGRQAQLPLFSLFFALLGGIEVFGAKGIVLGPLIMALAPLMLEIYRDRHIRSIRSFSKLTAASEKSTPGGASPGVPPITGVLDQPSGLSGLPTA